MLSLLPLGGAAHAGAASGDEAERARVAVFGFVRDTRGAAVSGAVVTAHFKALKLKIAGRSDATGAFRIAKLGDDDDVSEVSVSCTKDDYRFTREVPRHMELRPGRPAEIDCVLARQ
jgi:hypothetical protein